MGREVVVDQQAGFAGGVNTVSDPVFLSPDQARMMENLRLTNYGAVLKRLGTAIYTQTAVTTFDTTASSMYGGLFWENNGGGYNMIFCAGTGSTDSHMFTFNGSAWVDVGACAQFYPVVFNDGTKNVVYIGGNTNSALMKYDGSVLSTTTAPGTCGGICVYNDRLWGWRGTPGANTYTANTGSNLYFSNLASVIGSAGGDSLGDSSSAAAGGGVIQVNTFGATDIVTCRAVNGSLLIFHVRGISILTGWGQTDTTVQPQALNASIGMSNATNYGLVVANDISTGDVAYFITPLGVYMTNGGVVQPLATPQRPDPTVPYLQAGTVTPNNFVLAFSRRYSELWVGMIGIGVFIYNTVLRAWSGPFTGGYKTGLRVFYETDDGTNPPLLNKMSFNGSAGAGLFVSECDVLSTANDDVSLGLHTGGTAVTANLQLRRMTGQDRVFAKSWRWMNLLATLQSGGAAPIVTYTTQYGGTSTYTMTNISTAEKPYYVPLGGEGSYIDITVSDISTSAVAPNIYTLATVQGNKLGQR